MSLSGMNEIKYEKHDKILNIKKYCKKFVKLARKKKKKHIELIEKMRPGDLL